MRLCLGVLISSFSLATFGVIASVASVCHETLMKLAKQIAGNE